MDAGQQKFGPLQFAIIILTFATAINHLDLGLQSLDILFVLNGLGYAGLLALLYLPFDFLTPARPYFRWTLIGYTALTIVAYFYIHGLRLDTTIAILTKVIEVLLIILLLWER